LSIISANVCMPIGYFMTVDFRRKDTIYLEKQLGQLGQLGQLVCPVAERGCLGGYVVVETMVRK